MNKKPLIVFDLDGTIIDTLPDIAGAMNAVLNQLEQPPLNHSHYKKLIGRGTQNLVKCSIPSFLANQAESIHTNFEQRYQARLVEESHPFSDITEVLKMISESDAYLAVISNKIERLTKQLVNELFPTIIFDAIIGLSTKFPAKPDPSSLLSLTKLFPAESTYLIGDTSTDIKTAIAAGVTPLGVAWGYREKTQLEQSGAKIIFNSVAELKSWTLTMIN